jgi:hypothetical protein
VSGCLQAPGFGDAAVVDAEDVDLVDALEAPAGRWLAAPWSEVGGRAVEASDDLLAFGDEVDDLHADVGEAVAKRGDPPPRCGRHLRCVELVDEVQAAGVDDLVDQPPDDGLRVGRVSGQAVTGHTGAEPAQRADQRGSTEAGQQHEPAHPSSERAPGIRGRRERLVGPARQAHWAAISWVVYGVVHHPAP